MACMFLFIVKRIVLNWRKFLAEEEMEKSSRVPCILHMDSIRGTHKGLKNLIQRYNPFLVALTHKVE